MNKKFRVSFYLRSYKTKDGKSPVLIRLYLNRERLIIGSTGLYVDEKQWDNTKCRVKGRSTEANKLNEALERIELDLMHLFRMNLANLSPSTSLRQNILVSMNPTNHSLPFLMVFSIKLRKK